MSTEITKAMFVLRRAYDLIGNAETYQREIDNPVYPMGFFYQFDESVMQDIALHNENREHGPFTSAILRDRTLIAHAEQIAKTEWAIKVLRDDV